MGVMPLAIGMLPSLLESATTASRASAPIIRHESWYLVGRLDVGTREVHLLFNLVRKRLLSGPRWLQRLYRAAYVSWQVVDLEQGRRYADQRLCALAQLPERQRWSFRAAGLEGREQDGRLTFVLKLPRETLRLTLDPLKPAVPIRFNGSTSGSAGAAHDAPDAVVYPRMEARGVIEPDAGGRREPVHGVAWCELFATAQQPWHTATAYEWITLQLDDASELIYATTPWTYAPNTRGVLIDPQGRASPLDAGSVIWKPQANWQSARTGARYPVTWEFRTRTSPPLDLLIEALDPSQEVVSARWYAQPLWLGAARAHGRHGARLVTGDAYLGVVRSQPALRRLALALGQTTLNAMHRVGHH